MVDLKDVIVNAFKADRVLANNDQLVDVDEMIAVLVTIFESVDPKRKEIINIPQSVDMTLNWLLNVYDRCVLAAYLTRIGCLSSFCALVFLCAYSFSHSYYLLT